VGLGGSGVGLQVRPKSQPHCPCRESRGSTGQLLGAIDTGYDQRLVVLTRSQRNQHMTNRYLRCIFFSLFSCLLFLLFIFSHLFSSHLACSKTKTKIKAKTTYKMKTKSNKTIQRWGPAELNRLQARSLYHPVGAPFSLLLSVLPCPCLLWSVY
jgi:hypothetical protein